MSFFDLPPVIERMLLVSDKISDLNFSVGQQPQVEVNGKLTSVQPLGLQKLSPYQTEIIAMSLMEGNPDAASRLANTGSVDLSWSLPTKIRFRVNIFQQRGTYSIVMRVIPTEVPTLDTLALPPHLAEIASQRNGLVLVTGPIGTDAQSFPAALRSALRQAPKVILIGEMRDYETTEIALEAAETGHLVLSTLHTIDASKTVDRIIGLYPKNEEQVIRTRLAQTFRYIVSQRLIPRADGRGRTAAVEVLKSTPRTREYVAAGESDGKSLLDAMRDGRLDGMQDFDTVIKGMIEAKTVTLEDGLSFATNPNNLTLALSVRCPKCQHIVNAQPPAQSPQRDALAAVGDVPASTRSQQQGGGVAA